MAGDRGERARARTLARQLREGSRPVRRGLLKWYWRCVRWGGPLPTVSCSCIAGGARPAEILVQCLSRGIIAARGPCLNRRKVGLLLKGPLRKSCFTAGAPDMANCGSTLSALIRRREVPGVWVVGGVGLTTRGARGEGRAKGKLRGTSNGIYEASADEAEERRRVICRSSGERGEPAGLAFSAAAAFSRASAVIFA